MTNILREPPSHAEVERIRTQLNIAVNVLRNIAGGHWNAGREESITYAEYARDALKVLGR